LTIWKKGVILMGLYCFFWNNAHFIIYSKEKLLMQDILKKQSDIFQDFQKWNHICFQIL
jgi:DMSO/TMAO reductase YedYZ heme-binding membrane subunit